MFPLNPLDVFIPPDPYASLSFFLPTSLCSAFFSTLPFPPPYLIQAGSPVYGCCWYRYRFPACTAGGGGPVYVGGGRLHPLLGRDQAGVQHEGLLLLQLPLRLLSLEPLDGEGPAPHLGREGGLEPAPGGLAGRRQLMVGGRLALGVEPRRRVVRGGSHRQRGRVD